MKYRLNEDEKKIVKAIIQADIARKDRVQRGIETEFDRIAEKAIQAAGKEISMPGYEEQMKQYIIGKIYKSIRDHIPWEKMGETYCCRKLFYRYRKQYCYWIAVHMGIVKK